MNIIIKIYIILGMLFMSLFIVMLLELIQEYKASKLQMTWLGWHKHVFRILVFGFTIAQMLIFKTIFIN